MKSIIQRIMLSGAFVVGIAVPFAATWTNSAQALETCSFLSGNDSWSHTIPGSGSFTVTMNYATGVTVTGTPPPFASLPLTLTSTSGHVLRISTVVVGAVPKRQYEGSFTAGVPEVCSCYNHSCDNGHNCNQPDTGWTCLLAAGCTSTTCGGNGSCSGGVCQASTDFSARF